MLCFPTGAQKKSVTKRDSCYIRIYYGIIFTKRMTTLALFLYFSLFIGHWNLVWTLSVSETLTNGTRFHYVQLSEYPAKMATVAYEIESSERNVHMVIHTLTREEDSEIQEQCYSKDFGQLRNEDLYVTLKPGTVRSTHCEERPNGALYCTGETTIQDFIPRIFGVSFGFNCDDSEDVVISKTVWFNVTISGETNETECSPTPQSDLGCSRYYNHVTFPNLLGDASHHFVYDSIITTIEVTLSNLGLPKSLIDCHQHRDESLCYWFYPKCNSTLGLSIPPCKEICFGGLQGCESLVKLTKYGILNCDYLPSKDSAIPCFYKPVVCDDPPSVKNAKKNIGDAATNHNYSVNSKVVYSCENDGFYMEGNNTVTCLYSGKWSNTPTCIKLSKPNYLHLQIALPIAAIVIIVSVLVVVILCKHLKRPKPKHRNHLTRVRTFDAYVCYNFDTENHYVLNTVMPFLEDNQNSPFKLCLDTRDFKPGLHIKQNIHNAIENSNSAIIVMSQGFVDSVWCKEEFASCYIENMNDPAFKLFVIMMQPANTLQNLSEYMNSFITQQVYLERDDPSLFEKIAEYLAEVKQIEDANGDDDTTDQEETIFNKQ